MPDAKVIDFGAFSIKPHDQNTPYARFSDLLTDNVQSGVQTILAELDNPSVHYRAEARMMAGQEQWRRLLPIAADALGIFQEIAQAHGKSCEPLCRFYLMYSDTGAPHVSFTLGACASVFCTVRPTDGVCYDSVEFQIALQSNPRPTVGLSCTPPREPAAAMSTLDPVYLSDMYSAFLRMSVVLMHGFEVNEQNGVYFFTTYIPYDDTHTVHYVMMIDPSVYEVVFSEKKKTAREILRSILRF